jgi:DNA mismatch repair protein PMS2
MLQTLPPEVVRHLTSAPVVTSLASVTKELVENALDAEATQISVFLSGYGLEFIEVSDDGCGIAKQDLEQLAQLHTTSKLRAFAELSSISTYGFRGQALASLAMTGRLEISSRPRDRDASAVPGVAFRARYQAGRRISDLEPEARPYGTTVRVYELFASMPVRRREAESQKKRELQKAIQILQTYALAAPTVRFSVQWTPKGRERPTLCLATQGKCTLRSCFSLLYGAEQLTKLVDLAVIVKWPTPLPGACTEPELHMRGLLSRCYPAAGRSAPDRQMLLLQAKRPVQWTRMRRMLDSEFRQRTCTSLYPVYVLAIDLPPDTFDVNASPDKTEVLIHDDAAVVASVREALRTSWTQVADVRTRAPFSVQTGKCADARAKAPDDHLRAAQLANQLEWSVTTEQKRDTSQRLVTDARPACVKESATSTPAASETTLSSSGMSAGVCVASRAEVEAASFIVDHVKPHTTEQPFRESLQASSAAVAATTGAHEQWETAEPLAQRWTHHNAEAASSGTESSGTIHRSADTILSGVSGVNSHEHDRVVARASGASMERWLAVHVVIDPFQWTSSANISRSSGCARDADLPHVEPIIRARVGERLQLACLLEASTPNTTEDCVTESSTEADRELEQRFHKHWFEEMRIIGQFNCGFILATYGSDLFIIDQHAADEKYIYESLARALRPRTQSMLQPLSIPASASEELTLWEQRENLAALGFELEFRWSAPPTERVWMLGAPTVCQTVLEATDLLEIAHQAPLTGLVADLLRASRVKLLLATRACRRAVMIGMPLDRTHMQSIVARLATLEQPWNCPHGRPTMRHLVRVSEIGFRRAVT